MILITNNIIIMAAKVTIKVDYRERDFTTILQQRLCSGSSKDIKLGDPANLDIGDIIVSVAGYGEFIIERKRIDDMASSIKDGRYAEQKARCLSYIAGGAEAGICRILIYLVEGDMALCRTDADYNLVQGSWISMALRDKIPVVRVMTMEEGVRWLIRICERCISKPMELFPSITNPKPLVSNPDSQIKTIMLGGAATGTANTVGMDEEPGQLQDHSIKQVSQADYLATVKTKKKENITPATCAPVMLSVIPGMTTANAQVILDNIGEGSLAGLIRALTIPELPDLERDKAIKDKKKALAEINIKPGRKLGPALAEKVWDYLFNN